MWDGEDVVVGCRLEGGPGGCRADGRANRVEWVCELWESAGHVDESARTQGEIRAKEITATEVRKIHRIVWGTVIWAVGSGWRWAVHDVEFEAKQQADDSSGGEAVVRMLLNNWGSGRRRWHEMEDVQRARGRSRRAFDKTCPCEAEQSSTRLAMWHVPQLAGGGSVINALLVESGICPGGCLVPKHHRLHYPYGIFVQ